MSLYPYPDRGDAPRYGIGMYEWATARSYRWVGDACIPSPSGRAVTPHDYLPRRVMGEYLQWFYAALVADAPPGVEILHHRTTAVDVVAAAHGRESVLLADGRSIEVDHVIVTSGHTENAGVDPEDMAVPALYPYPVEAAVREIPGRKPLGVAGMGLVALDVVAGLTLGRGGLFVDRGDRKRYVPSGREPVLMLFSRSGLPYNAKSVAAADPTGEYEPVIFTERAVADLRGEPGRPARTGGVDLRRDLLPLIFGEMQVRYYSQSALLASGETAKRAAIAALSAAWQAGEMEREVATYSARYGPFDAVEHLLGVNETEFVSSKDYEAWAYSTIEADLDEALKQGTSSPIKAAHEVLRVLRDPMRQVIEFGGLSRDSYLDFHDNVRSRVLRLVAGPPVVRSKQLLALMEAGIVHLPSGPSPRLERATGSAVKVSSTHLDRPYSGLVDQMIRGHLDDPSIVRSASPLLRNLYGRGRITQMHYGETAVGSIALSSDAHPVDAGGAVQDKLWFFGPVTEGVRYFTHYIPSPKSRVRMFLDAEACLEEVLC
jgi:uncharacterized NAD(P)/FAD-binding protein YdhS